MLIYKSIKDSPRFKPRMTRDQVREVDRSYARAEQNRSDGDKMRAQSANNHRREMTDTIKETLRTAIKKGGCIERPSDVDIELTLDGRKERIDIGR